MPKIFRKPAPYMVLPHGDPIKEGGGVLRQYFAKLMAKRLPTVCYQGFKHGDIPHYIQQHKKQYPYFLKVDIAKFYPSLSHHHLMVEAQLAYKNLIGLSYVPKNFKTAVLPLLHHFFQTLPTEAYGLPLNSGMAKALAPLIYVNYLLPLKKQSQCKFIAYADDLVFLCMSREKCEEIYNSFINYLYHMELRINVEKVQQGRFSKDTLDFCGYRFSGGYVSISPWKIEDFKNKIKEQSQKFLRTKKKWEERSFIKSLNAKVNGFGHYYKYANVHSLFERLDAFIRQNIRKTYKSLGLAMPTLSTMRKLGLRSLVDIFRGEKQGLISKPKYQDYKETQRHTSKQSMSLLVTYIEKLIHQQSEIIAQLKSVNKQQQEMINLLSI
ncbi:reverse transcriptase domain-containing protein [Ornithobacterium rhinotracheale]|uniref:Group II intron maturase family protein n=3 Tax=Ornithobacterium rhinotracheale TaxID=28251 RepID=I3ZZQ2_ORNRL|nr:reverse transcriptase domain-containing protein [Ornithobacterium rhinotracheale]AFL97186.1 group II intron maturase family protein [Ornithobacterium rhinotracheale DSM 15997]AIQ00484.1 hypothetical protein Q785_05565 [Ornithobacterium rhinotracheale ORT-UMN 88]KGB67465.1 hypothetical protein Q787_05450 [Ornithobacterium rhinotracheale H06-030791]MBN3662377.1 hypothetical protein [Ornithobacterium rhinotracheale]MCK0194290.1 reverse transcriptase domain-containing protein [Ornithobacterium 